MDILESLENLNVSEECFKDIIELIEDLLDESNYTAGDMVKAAQRSKDNLVDHINKVDPLGRSIRGSEHPLIKKYNDYNHKQEVWSQIKPDVPAKKVRQDAKRSQLKHTKATDAAIKMTNNVIANPKSSEDNYDLVQDAEHAKGREEKAQTFLGKKMSDTKPLGRAHIPFSSNAVSRKGDEEAGKILKKQLEKKNK